jgi:hypothetical protein
MPNPLGALQTFPARNTSRELWKILVQVNIGASGAATVVGTAEVTCVKNTTGIYDCTFPPMPAQATSLGFLKGGVVKSAAKTVSKIIVTAIDLAAGTATFTTALTAGTAAEPASGDILWLEFIGNPTGI